MVHQHRNDRFMRREQHLPDADVADGSAALRQDLHAEACETHRGFLLQGISGVGGCIVKVHQIALHLVGKDSAFCLLASHFNCGSVVYTPVETGKEEKQYGKTNNKGKKVVFMVIYCVLNTLLGS